MKNERNVRSLQNNRASAKVRINISSIAGIEFLGLCPLVNLAFKNHSIRKLFLKYLLNWGRLHGMDLVVVHALLIFQNMYICIVSRCIYVSCKYCISRIFKIQSNNQDDNKSMFQWILFNQIKSKHEGKRRKSSSFPPSFIPKCDPSFSTCFQQKPFVKNGFIFPPQKKTKFGL